MSKPDPDDRIHQILCWHSWYTQGVDHWKHWYILLPYRLIRFLVANIPSIGSLPSILQGKDDISARLNGIHKTIFDMRETFGEICSQIDQSESPAAEKPTFEEIDHLIGLRLCRMSRACFTTQNWDQHPLNIYKNWNITFFSFQPRIGCPIQIASMFPKPGYLTVSSDEDQYLTVSNVRARWNCELRSRWVNFFFQFHYRYHLLCLYCNDSPDPATNLTKCWKVLALDMHEKIILMATHPAGTKSDNLW